MDSKLEIDQWGDQEWRNELGQYHRLNGPAYIGSNGTQIWCRNGLKHRIGGPAKIWANGYQEWWDNGVFIKSGFLISETNLNWKKYGF